MRHQRQMWQAQSDTASGWIMFAVSVAVSWIVRRSLLMKRPFVLYNAGCMAAVMRSVCRDFDIPTDMMVIVSLPMFFVNWKRSLPVQIAWYGVFILNYVLVAFWVDKRSLTIPSNSFAMTVFTIITLAKARSFVLTLGIVLCRQIFWKPVHVFYGIILCCHTTKIRLPLLDPKVALCFVVYLCFFVSLVFSDAYAYILGSIGIVSCFYDI
jgi:hypothetical protein